MDTKLHRVLKIALVLILVLAGTLLYVWTSSEITACASHVTPDQLASWLDRCFAFELARRVAELVVGVISAALIADFFLRQKNLEEIRSIVGEIQSTTQGPSGFYLYVFRCDNHAVIWGVFDVSRATGRLRVSGEAFYGGQPADGANRRGFWRGALTQQSEQLFAIKYAMLIQKVPAWGGNHTHYEGRFDFTGRRSSLSPALSEDIYVGDIESSQSSLIVGTAMAVRLRTPEMLPAPHDPAYYPALQELVRKCLGTEVRPLGESPHKGEKVA